MFRDICYQVHLQDTGWQNQVCNGAIADTTGEARRMEAIRITGSPALGPVCYQVHVQDVGWQDSVCDGAVAGTTGRSKRLEAVQIFV